MSKVLKRAPFTDYRINVEQLVNSIKDAQQYHQHALEELQSIAKQHGTRQALNYNDLIEKGDQVIVNLSCESCDKYQKQNLPITLGAGLYDTALEEHIPGMHVGEKQLLTVNNTRVQIELVSATRRHIPQINDDLIKQAQIEHATSVNEFLAHYVKEERTADLVDYLYSKELMLCLGYAINNSEFEINKFEMGAFVARRRQSFEQAAQQEGITALEMLEGMFNKQQNSTEDELYTAFNEYLERDYKINLYALDYFAEQGKYFDTDSYEELVIDAMRDHGITREEVLETLPYDDYLGSYPFSELAQAVLPFLIKQAEEVLERRARA